MDGGRYSTHIVVYKIKEGSFMINVLTFIWVLIGIILGGALLITTAATVIGLIVCGIGAIFKGLKKK